MRPVYATDMVAKSKFQITQLALSKCYSSMTNGLLQITTVIDSYDGQDPFNGDGHMAKGCFLRMQDGTSRAATIEQFLLAMTDYRYICTPLPASYSCVSLTHDSTTSGKLMLAANAGQGTRSAGADAFLHWERAWNCCLNRTLTSHGQQRRRLQGALVLLMTRTTSPGPATVAGMHRSVQLLVVLGQPTECRIWQPNVW